VRRGRPPKNREVVNEPEAEAAAPDANPILGLSLPCMRVIDGLTLRVAEGRDASFKAPAPKLSTPKGKKSGGLGCSRCRYAAHGCSGCNPARSDYRHATPTLQSPRPSAQSPTTSIHSPSEKPSENEPPKKRVWEGSAQVFVPRIRGASKEKEADKETETASEIVRDSLRSGDYTAGVFAGKPGEFFVFLGKVEEVRAAGGRQTESAPIADAQMEVKCRWLHPGWKENEKRSTFKFHHEGLEDDASWFPAVNFLTAVNVRENVIFSCGDTRQDRSTGKASPTQERQTEVRLFEDEDAIIFAKLEEHKTQSPDVD
jgi:hypothetical protein